MRDAKATGSRSYLDTFADVWDVYHRPVAPMVCNGCLCQVNAAWTRIFRAPIQCKRSGQKNDSQRMNKPKQRTEEHMWKKVITDYSNCIPSMRPERLLRSLRQHEKQKTHQQWACQESSKVKIKAPRGEPWNCHRHCHLESFDRPDRLGSQTL